jgi:sulfur-carrier protein
MPVVRLRGTLKTLADDCAEHRVHGRTVAELLYELQRLHPGVRGWILDERGVVRQHIAVFVNGDHCDGDTPVAADDCVDVLPAISGG